MPSLEKYTCISSKTNFYGDLAFDGICFLSLSTLPSSLQSVAVTVEEFTREEEAGEGRASRVHRLQSQLCRDGDGTTQHSVLLEVDTLSTCFIHHNCTIINILVECSFWG